MISTSLECRKLMQTNTGFQEYVTITLADTNHTALTIPQNDLVIQNNGIVSGAAANSFPIGQASARTIRLEIANFDDKYSEYDFYGARIGLVVKYPLPTAEGADQRYEPFNYSFYTVISPETRGTTIKITAVDDMYKADKPYSTNLTFPQTALQVWLDACQTLGIAVQTATFTNSDFVVQTKPHDCTFRQVLGGCAMLAGGNAYINREGRMEIKAYDSAPLEQWLQYDGGVYSPWEIKDNLSGGTFNPWNTGDVADGDSFQNMLNGIHVLYAWLTPPSVDTDDITITGVRVETGSDESILQGEDGYVLTIENPLIEGNEADALELIGDEVIGLKFRQFSGEYIGDPTIEFMDPCIVVDRKGNTYGSYVTDVDYSFRGKTSISNSAEPKIRTGISYASNDTKTMQKARSLVETRLTGYDLGIMMLTQLMSQSIGMYTTRETDANGATVFYTHDKPTLAESTIIRKITANGITQSVDGGETWTSGIDANGNAVLNTLAAIGINCDWLNAGSITIQDENGNETFYANTQTGAVRINATSLIVAANAISVGGKTVNTIASEAASGALSDAQSYVDAKMSGVDTNLLKDSLGLSDTYWRYNGTLTRNQSDPFGGTNAVLLTPPSGGEGYLQAIPSTNNPFGRTGVRYKLSVWLKASRSTSNPMKLYLNGMGSDDFVPTTTWAKYETSGLVNTPFSANDLITIGGFSSFTSSDNYNLYIYNPVCEYTFTAEEIYKAVSDDGTTRGWWMVGNKLYMNMDYLQGGIAKFGGSANATGRGGSIEVYNDNDERILLVNKDKFEFESTVDMYNNFLTSYYGAQQTFYARAKGDSLYNYVGSVGAWAWWDGVSTWYYPMGICGNSAIYLFIGSMTANNTVVTIRKDTAVGKRMLVEGKVFANSYENNSDRRLKENITSIESDIIDKLIPVSFDWKETKQHSYGFIAQEVKKICPDLVSVKDDGMLSLNYIGIIPHLVHKVQQQQKQINDLETRLARLEAIINGNS